MNADQILDLLEDSDLEFEDNDDYDADPSFTLPNQHGNNILCESSDSEIRQFVKGKPRPVGLKHFVITTSDGLIIDYEIYQRLTTPFSDKSLGLGPAVILRLIITIPDGSSVFFDHYFMIIPLMKKLVQLKIHGTSTIQMNRLQKFQFKADSKMKRGDLEEVISDDKNISMLKWKDNKSVVTTSLCYGGLPTTTVSRWDKTQKKYIDVQIPNMISKYNEKMGGVDHFDQMMEYYRTWLKTRKWPLKFILHLLDLSVTNNLLQFRLEIGECLTMATPPPPTYQDTEEDGEPPIKIKPPAPIPGDDVRLDAYHHEPRAMDLKAPLSCRYKGYTSRSKVMCTKCKTFLWMSKGKMCFENYHQLK
ncbi:piggyBac transposable element-derived protein 3-like [Melanaphis sacchari]|uniref:piggyBac transposable element-derived protein 3-like n=1 Tax=Melanaphis sacchari TaxID=742174 RepID=UPI000DC13891|nr:piggyBac transposable element-derived protein 3-like [Melanaphis sacchari]